MGDTGRMTDHTSGSAGQGSEHNPFSREGATADDGVGTEAGASSTDSGSADLGSHGSSPIVPGESWSGPGSSAPGADPSGYGQGSGYGQPLGGADDQQPSPGSYGQPGLDPYSQPPGSGYGPLPGASSYGQQPGAGTYGQQPGAGAYGEPAQSYGQPTANPPYGQASANPPYEAAPGYGQGAPGYGYGQQDYGQAGYGLNPYQGAAGYPAYGMAAQQHPQAVPALITGILGLAICPPVGIAGLVLGSRVRREIDSDPQRYTGRGMGTAGFVLGILSIVYLVLVVFLIIIGASTS